MKEMEKWRTSSIPPGYAGNEKCAIEDARNKVYGAGNWRNVWAMCSPHSHPPDPHSRSPEWFPEWHMSNKGAVILYEDAYCEYFKKNPNKLEWIAKNASDVYDNSETNVDSGLDYSIQESDSVHLQDISIRRCMVRLGMQFKGKELLQIRSAGAGAEFNPGHIPFHLPYMISMPELDGWWKPGSIESFYQSNKRLQVRGKSAWRLGPHLETIMFATGNEGKFKSVRKAFEDIGEKELACSLDQMDLDISDLYSDVIKNAKHKVKVAFATLCQQSLCDNFSVVVPALGGWPGANVNKVLQEIGLEGFLRKLDGTNREAYFHQVLAYADWEGKLHFFEEKGEMGVFADKPRGTLKPWHKSELMRAFIPTSGKPETVAELDENKLFVRPGRYKEFAELYRLKQQMRESELANCYDPDEADDYERGRK